MSIFGAPPRVAEHLGLVWTQRPAAERIVDLLAALVDADEMSPDDADAWLARFRIADADGGEVVPDLADRAQTVVERSLSEASDRWLTAQQVISAVAALGAVPPEKSHEWYRRLGSLAPAPHGHQADERELRRPAAVAAAHVGELQRVIAGPVKLGASMQVTSAEIYEGAVALRWHYNADDARFPPTLDWGGVHFRVEDELGTEYIGRGAGASRLDRHEGEDAAVSGRDVFIPAPPPGASELLVEYDANHGRLSCRQRR
jgi:hypothetical protein